MKSESKLIFIFFASNILFRFVMYSIFLHCMCECEHFVLSDILITFFNSEKDNNLNLFTNDNR